MGGRNWRYFVGIRMVWEGPEQGMRFESPYTKPVSVKERGERKKTRFRDLAAGLRED